MFRRSRRPNAKRRLTFESLEIRQCMSAVADAFESDDSWQTAKDLPTTGVVQARTIHVAADQDWAKFTLTEASRVTVQTDGPAGDTRLWLYAAGDTTRSIAYDDDSGNGSFSLVLTTLDPGTYFVQVDEYGRNATIDAYTLAATAVPLRQLMDAFEADDTAQTAKVLPTSGTAQNRTIHRPTDVDWVKFTLAEASRVTLDTAGPTGDGELTLYAADPTRSIAYDDDSGEGYFPRIATTLDAGTYYAKFNDRGQNDVIDAYTLSATAIPLRQLMDAFEADDTAQAARAITAGAAAQTHSLHRLTDADWVKFTLTAPGDVVLQTDGPAGGTYLTLYGASDTANPLAADSDSGPGYFSRIAKALAAGTYYARVTMDGQNQWLDYYSLALSVFPPADLAIAAGTVTPAGQVDIGVTVSINWTVANQGSGAADPGHNNNASWTDSVYLSTDSTLSSDDVYLGSAYHYGALASNASYSASRQVTLPRDVAWAGRSAHLLVKADVDARVSDTNASNNLRAVPLVFNPVIELQSPGPGRYVDTSTPVRFAAWAYDVGGLALVDIALDNDNNPSNGQLRWLGNGLSVTNSSTPLAVATALTGVTPQSSPYYIWARIRRTAGGDATYSRAMPITVAPVAAMSDDPVGDTVGGSSFEVFGLDAARFDRSLYFTVRTNYNPADVGGGGDLRLVVGNTVYGLAVNTHTIANGSQVLAGDLYRGATFKAGTTVTTVPTFIDAYTGRVSGRSVVNVARTTDRPWSYEIQARVDLAGFADYQPGTTVTASWSMYCGNDTDDVSIQPDEMRPDIQMVSGSLQKTKVAFSFNVTGPLTSINVGLYQSADATFDSTDKLVTSRTVAAAAGSPGSGAFDAPKQLDIETRYLLVVADPQGSIVEASETNNVVATLAPTIEVAAKSITWVPLNESVRLTYRITSDVSPTSLPLALFWTPTNSGEPTLYDIVSTQVTPVFARTITNSADLTKGVHTLSVATSDFASDAPYQGGESPRILASHLMLALDPVSKLNEANRSDNTKGLRLRRVTAAPDFCSTLGNVSLDSGLVDRVMSLAARLVSRNFVTSDIRLKDGVRSKPQAHRWSTTYGILKDHIMLQTLQSLPDGKDVDGNTWYNAEWLDGLPTNADGTLTSHGLAQLWKRIKNNARSVSADRNGNYDLTAAEGYPDGDARQAPNDYPKVSKHCLGHAIDVTVPWRIGPSQAEKLVAEFDLSRPVPGEVWHYERAN
jgi:hypothetical protein